jgi:hypothetical protein
MISQFEAESPTDAPRSFVAGQIGTNGHRSEESRSHFCTANRKQLIARAVARVRKPFWGVARSLHRRVCRDGCGSVGLAELVCAVDLSGRSSASYRLDVEYIWPLAVRGIGTARRGRSLNRDKCARFVRIPYPSQEFARLLKCGKLTRVCVGVVPSVLRPSPVPNPHVVPRILQSCVPCIRNRLAVVKDRPG